MIHSLRRTLAIGLLAIPDDGGTSAEFFSAGARADHRASYVRATLALKPWFDGCVKPAAR